MPSIFVADASAVIHHLLVGVHAHQNPVDYFKQSVAAPFLIDAEVVQVIRRYVLNAEISKTYAAKAVSVYMRLPIARQPHLPILERAFEFRHSLTIYDALYVALAERLHATLVTCDAAMVAVAKTKGVKSILIA